MGAPAPQGRRKQGRINRSGAHTNVRRGPFSHTRTHYFLSRDALFSSQKVDDLFSRRRYVQTSTLTQRGKILALDRGPPRDGSPLPWYTTGTMDNPALGEKIRRTLQGRFVSAPPAHQVHPMQTEQRVILGHSFCWAGRFGGGSGSFSS